MNPSSVVLAQRSETQEGSVKYVWQLHDGQYVESVLFQIAFSDVLAPVGYSIPDDHILCISSQVGCNVRCRFCATGLQPSRRNLTVSEIIDQVVSVRREYPHYGLKVLFAGMGEPLLNYDNVVAATTDLLASRLTRKVSISTIGIPYLIRKLATEDITVGLHLSLHATSDETRTSLIPLNHKFPLKPTLEAVTFFALERKVKVRISYLLLPGINASLDDADRLAELLDPTLFHVQLLLWNYVADLPFSRISDAEAVAFCERLQANGLGAHVILSSGRELDAGCGQLATQAPSATRLREILVALPHLRAKNELCGE